MDSLCSKNGRRNVGGAGIDFFHVFFCLFSFFCMPSAAALIHFIPRLAFYFMLCFSFL